MRKYNKLKSQHKLSFQWAMPQDVWYIGNLEWIKINKTRFQIIILEMFYSLQYSYLLCCLSNSFLFIRHMSCDTLCIFICFFGIQNLITSFSVFYAFNQIFGRCKEMYWNSCQIKPVFKCFRGSLQPDRSISIWKKY